VSLDISNAQNKNTVALLDYWMKLIKHLVTVRYDTISKISTHLFVMKVASKLVGKPGIPNGILCED
jgi:hypothetical protein